MSEQKTAHTPGPEYAQNAYRACLYGRADKNQQQSAAAQISLLHGVKGELSCALSDLLAALPFSTVGDPDVDAAVTKARTALAKAEGRSDV